MNRTDGAGVPDGSNDGKEENGAQVIKKQPVGHEISSVQDDGRQHVQEEDVGGQGGRRVIGGQEEQEADQDTDDDQKT